MHELIIIGGGPAGAAAGVYAARKMIATLLVAEEFGGQSVVSGEIQNWIGTPSLTGLELARSLEGHLRAQDGTIEMWDGERVEEVVKTEGGWGVRTSGGKTAEAKTLLLASGSRRKKLGVPGEDRLSGRGVVYCSTCDAPLFKGKATAVVGGGNAALEAVLDLVPYASEIHLIVRSDALKGDAVTQERVRRHSKVNISFGAVVKEIRGVDTVTGIELDDTAGGVLRELPVEGVFVEIGAAANSDLVKGLADLNDRGEVVVDPKTQETSQRGIWAAGDVTDVLYKQNNISAGDAVKAVLNIHDHLRRLGTA